MSEHTEQAAVISWFRFQYPKIAPLLFSHIDGAIIGGENKYGAIAKLKKEGWTKGIPDLMLALPAYPYSGLWIEMKDVKKTKGKSPTLSKVQKEYLELFGSVGYAAHCCYGFEQAQNVIQMYLKGVLPDVQSVEEL